MLIPYHRFLLVFSIDLIKSFKVCLFENLTPVKCQPAERHPHRHRISTWVQMYLPSVRQAGRPRGQRRAPATSPLPLPSPHSPLQFLRRGPLTPKLTRSGAVTSELWASKPNGNGAKRLARKERSSFSPSCSRHSPEPNPGELEGSRCALVSSALHWFRCRCISPRIRSGFNRRKGRAANSHAW
jgi:hypothetical protein